MKMRIAVIHAIVFALLLVASCSSPKGPTVNRLMVEDDWIYYGEFTDKGELDERIYQMTL